MSFPSPVHCKALLPGCLTACWAPLEGVCLKREEFTLGKPPEPLDKIAVGDRRRLQEDNIRVLGPVAACPAQLLHRGESIISMAHILWLPSMGLFWPRHGTIWYVKFSSTVNFLLLGDFRRNRSEFIKTWSMSQFGI